MAVAATRNASHGAASATARPISVAPLAPETRGDPQTDEYASAPIPAANASSEKKSCADSVDTATSMQARSVRA